MAIGRSGETVQATFTLSKKLYERFLAVVWRHKCKPSNHLELVLQLYIREYEHENGPLAQIYQNKLYKRMVKKRNKNDQYPSATKTGKAERGSKRGPFRQPDESDSPAE